MDIASFRLSLLFINRNRLDKKTLYCEFTLTKTTIFCLVLVYVVDIDIDVPAGPRFGIASINFCM